MLLAEVWVRALPVALPVSLAIAAMLAVGYGAIGEVLRRRLGGLAIFSDRAGMLQWAGIVVAGTLATSLAFVLVLVGLGLIPPEDWRQAVGRYWIGDGVGILVTMPLLWMLFDEQGRAQLGATLMRRDTLGHVLLAAAALWVAFGLGAESEFKYFYVLFLPIVWAAARRGLAGAVLSAALVQTGIIVAVQSLGFAAVTVFEIQALTVVLALVGFFVGIVVDAQQRISAELRQTLRLAAAGEMAGALAHELNQPLSAIANYCMGSVNRLKSGDYRREDILAAMEKASAQAERAGKIIRRTREFVKKSAPVRAPVALAEIVEEAIGFADIEARKAAVPIRVDIPADLPPVFADRIMIEQVVLNLVKNGIEAMQHTPPGERALGLAARLDGEGMVEVAVADRGCGLTAEQAERLFTPFFTTKAEGMGMGLNICRSIVEYHDGRLWLEHNPGGGSVFRFTLPVGTVP